MNIYIGSDPTLGLPVANLQKDAKSINTKNIALNEQGQSFMDVLGKSLDAVSNSQNEAAVLGQQALINPDSVDVHQVTTAMAKANMSLSLAKSVIDKSVAGFKEILNQR